MSSGVDYRESCAAGYAEKLVFGRSNGAKCHRKTNRYVFFGMKHSGRVMEPFLVLGAAKEGINIQNITPGNFWRDVRHSEQSPRRAAMHCARAAVAAAERIRVLRPHISFLPSQQTSSTGMFFHGRHLTEKPSIPSWHCSTKYSESEGKRSQQK